MFTNINSVHNRNYFGIYFLLFIFSFSLGILFNKYGYLINFKHNIESAIDHSSEYAKFSFKDSKKPLLTSFKLKGKFKNTLGLSRERSNYFYSVDYLLFGRQWKEQHEWYKFRFKTDNSKSKSVKVKLFGLNSDHWAHPYLWSFRIRTKQIWPNLSVNSKFNLIRPKSRLYYTDALVNRTLSSSYPVTIPYKLLLLEVPGNDRKHLYMQEGFFTKELIEQNRQRESIIFSLDDVNHTPFNQEQTENIVDYYRKQILTDPSSIMEKEILNQLIILRALTNYHAFSSDNLHYYLNPLNEKLYPIYRELRFEIDPINFNRLTNDELFIQAIDEILPSNTWYSNYFKLKVESDVKYKKELYRDFLNLVKKLQSTYYEDEFQDFADRIKYDDPGSLKLLEELEYILKSHIPNENHKIQIEKPQITNIDNIILDKDSTITKKQIMFTHSPNINLNGYQLKIEDCQFLNDFTNGVIHSTSPEGSLLISNCGLLKMKNSIVTNLSPYKGAFIDLPSCFTLYRSNLKAINCVFEKNILGDDLVNVFGCSKVEFIKCEFNSSHADALDSDFSNVMFNYCSFNSIGNDAIDGSGTNAKVFNCNFKNIEDKAISAGENSVFDLDSNGFISCALALVVKDGSSIQENNTSVRSCELSVVAFNKKWQYSTPTATIKSLNLLLNHSDYLIQKGAQINLSDTSISLNLVNDVESLLYGNVYGKPSK